MEQQLSSLDAYRLRAERLILLMVWLHGPVILLAGILTGNIVIPLVLGTAIALTGTAASRTAPGLPGTRITLGAVLVLMPAVLLVELRGTSWVIDIHMGFFAELALVAAMLDARAIIASAAVIALHHLVLNAILPALIFPDGADYGRVLLHALIVVAESAGLIWITRSAAAAIVKADEATAALGHAAAEKAAAEERSREEQQARRAALVGHLTTDLHSKISGLVGALSNGAGMLEATARRMSEAASSADTQVHAVADACHAASASVETVAAAAEQLSNSISEINQQVAASARVTGEAVAGARRSDATMRALSESAERIDEVVRIIADVAGRTNLLALNATIEAARAGEAGRGFAVVASEVKALASQTARATEEIKGQIAQVQAATKEAADTIGGVAGTIGQVDSIALAISAAMEQQGGATGEIARNVQYAAQATGNVTLNLNGVAGSVSATGGAALEVLDAAAVVSRQSEMLESAVNCFIAELKAA